MELDNFKFPLLTDDEYEWWQNFDHQGPASYMNIRGDHFDRLVKEYKRYEKRANRRKIPQDVLIQMRHARKRAPAVWHRTERAKAEARKQRAAFKACQKAYKPRYRRAAMMHEEVFRVAARCSQGDDDDGAFTDWWAIDNDSLDRCLPDLNQNAIIDLATSDKGIKDSCVDKLGEKEEKDEEAMNDCEASS